MGMLVAFFWSREERTAALWYSLPFALGAVGAGFTVNPVLKAGDLGLRLGALFVLMAYGFGWQAVRVFYRKPPLPLAVVAACLLYFGFATLLYEYWYVPALNSSVRGALVSLFAGLAAYEFWLQREDEDLPSRKILFCTFAAYSVFCALRIPLVFVLPKPLGVAPTEAWAVVVFNLASVVMALMASMFMIVLSRERTAAVSHGLALRDAMTGLYNRRAYYERIEALSDNGRKDTQSYAILLLDIDKFKSINDRFGHAVGDKVIILAGQAAEASLRKSDQVFRIGGEEFACLLPGASAEEAYEAAERLRAAFRESAAMVDGFRVDATISIGVATTAKDRNADSAFAAADKALYMAKRSGRNRSVKAAIA